MSQNYASTIVALALNEVGYLEKKTNNNIYSKTGNAGYNNFTKYAADLDKIDGFYNGKKNGYAWCSCFVDYLGVKAFGESEMKRITYHTIYGAGCTNSARQYKSKGRFYSSPKVGDEIFFGSSINDCEHTGLVVAVTATTVYTVEGNTSSASGVVANGGAVAKKSYSRTYKKIVGYGRPLYDAEPSKTPAKVNTSAAKVKINKTVQAWQTAAARDGFRFPSGADGIWGKECETVAKSSAAQVMVGSKNNDLIKFVQKQLGFKGEDVDGIFGNKTKSAVKKYQKKKKLKQDGIVGYKTYKALCGIK
jgi:hypothetical protein